MRSVTNRVALVMMLALTCNGYATAEVTDSMSLDGTWEIVFDRDNEGRERHWQENAVFGGHPERRQIQVPSCWEEIEQDYEGVAFYRRKFMVPQSWAGRTIELDFGAVNYVAQVFVNDRSGTDQLSPASIDHFEATSLAVACVHGRTWRRKSPLGAGDFPRSCS